MTTTHTAPAARSLFALDYRCTDHGDWAVLQGHADYCAAHGHASYVVDGERREHCPRCGERTTSELDAAAQRDAIREHAILAPAKRTADAIAHADAVATDAVSWVRAYVAACDAYIDSPAHAALSDKVRTLAAEIAAEWAEDGDTRAASVAYLDALGEAIAIDDQDRATLAELDAELDAERDAASAARVDRTTAAELVAVSLTVAALTTGGATVNARGCTATSGVMVGRGARLGLIVENVADVDVTAVIAWAHRAMPETRAGDCFGVWVDAETGRVYFDVSEPFGNVSDALRAAHGRGELAVYDIATGCEYRVADHARGLHY